MHIIIDTSIHEYFTFQCKIKLFFSVDEEFYFGNKMEKFPFVERGKNRFPLIEHLIEKVNKFQYLFDLKNLQTI